MTTREFFAAELAADKSTQPDPDRDHAVPSRPDRPFAALIDDAAPASTPPKPSAQQAETGSPRSPSAHRAWRRSSTMAAKRAPAIPPASERAVTEAGPVGDPKAASFKSSDTQSFEDATPKEVPAADATDGANSKVDPTAVPANLIPFPSAVIIPFPQPIPDAALGEAGGNASAFTTSSVTAELQEVEIDVAWPMTRKAGDERNVEAIDPQSQQDDKVIPVVFSAGALRSSSPLSDASAPSHLPGAIGQRENSAYLVSAPPVGVEKKARSGGAISAEGHRAEHREAGANPHGIAAAPDAFDMDSEHNVERPRVLMERPQKGLEELDPANESEGEERSPEFSARSLGAMDWQMGRPVGLPDRPAPVPAADTASSGGSSHAVVTVDRLSQLVLRESALIRQHGSDAMSVVLRPDAETELYVHFSQQNGQLCAAVRCERGDFQHLNQLWPQLQESLAHQKIALAPLQESSLSNTNGQERFGAAFDSFNARQESHSGRQPWGGDTPSAEPEPGSSASPGQTAADGRRGTRPAAAANGRPGWETWA